MDDTGHHLEQFAGEMLRSPVAARGIVDFVRIGLGIGNELGNALGWKRRIDLHDVWHADNSGNRREVTEEIVIENTAAHRLGWTAEELFGPPGCPEAGAIWRLEGRSIVAVTARSIVV